MKKLFVLIALVMLASFSKAQTTTYKGDFAYIDFGHLTTDVDKIGYANFSDWTQIDSITAVCIAYGEINIDSVDCYPGVISSSLTAYSSTVAHYGCSVDLAASTAGYEALAVSNATVLTSAIMRGANAVKVLVRGAHAGGNTASGNQKCVIALRVWGTK